MTENHIGKVLVVDDEVELKNVLVESLTSQGYEAVGFTCGEAALAALREQPFDVLLTDLMMPSLDGISLVRQALEIDRNLVPIMMTGQGTIQTAVDAMRIGAFDYVLKPFRLQTMLPVLTRAMNTRHLRLENVQLREAVAIHELSETIAFTLDLQTVLSKLADGALHQSGADEVSILLPTTGSQELYVAAVRGEKRERLLGERVPLQESISSWVARERQPLILNGKIKDQRFIAHWPRADIRSAVSIPMQVANKLVGVINLNMTNARRPFTLGQMKALTILAGTAAAALESASLHTQVKEAERGFRSIFENAVEGIFRSTTDRRFLTVNPALVDILGFASAEDLIASYTDIGKQLFVDPILKQEVTKSLAESDVLKGLEFEAYRKDRSKIWLCLNIRVIRNEAGKEIFREGTLEDITQRKQDERDRAKLTGQIESQRQRLDSIVKSVPGMVWELWANPDAAAQKIDFVSDYVETMLGYSVDEWISTPNFWLTIVHPDDKQEISRAAQKAFANGIGGTQEFRLLAKDGRIVWTEANFVVIRDLEGQPLGMRGVCTDITRRKRAEAERSVMLEIIQGSITTRNLNEFLELIHESLGKVLYAENCFVGLYDETTQLVHFEYWADQFDSLPPPQSPGKGFSSYVLRTNRPLLLTEEGRARLHATGEVEKSGRTSAAWLGVPLRLSEKALGVVVVQHYEDRDAFSQRDLEFLSLVGDQIALAMERKRAEEALQETLRSKAESLALLDTLLSSAPIGFAFYNRDLVYERINESLAAINGFSIEEHLGRTTRDMLPRMAEMLEPLLQSVIDTGEPIIGLEINGQTSLTNKRQDCWLVSFYPVRMQGGELLGVGVLVSDITERKRAEEALRQSEGQLAEAQRLAHIGSWNWDLNKQKLTWSDEHYRIFGIQRGDANLDYDTIVAQAIHPEDQALVQNEVKRTIASGEAFNFYYRIIRPNGEERILQSTGSVETDEQQQRVRLFGTAQDVTERSRIEQELRQSEERYRDLVENAHDIIYSHDLEGNYTSMNKAGQLITGYTRDEALALNLTNTVAPDFIEKAKDMTRRKLAGEDVTAYEMVILAKDGHRVAVEANTKLIFHEGLPVGVQGIARDVTERKQMEEALRASEDQLRQSQKLEAIGQLAGGVAHDFNNLLTVIGGYSSILLGKLPPDSPYRSSIEEIKKAGDRASSLTRQLLAFSRKQILQPKVLDLNLVVSDLEKMVRRLIGEDIDLLTVTYPVLGKVKADPGQIEQVLMNLIVNARDAMPKGGKLTIETRNVVISEDYAQRHATAPGRYVMLGVSDTGCGIDPEVKPRVFEPFFTTKGSGKGTGLGLATVYGIVRQSGGNIWVYSEVDRGTTFKIYLPRVDEALESEDAPISRTVPQGTETVLLVEDEEQVRAILKHILEDLGYCVLSASNGEEALVISQDLGRDIELMITDVVMPQMSGRELAERVLELRPMLPVLFMSGYTDDAIVRHGLLDEKLNFIQKPFDAAGVARKVREVLDSQPAHQPS
ncbi:MAG: two-component system, cell cycle sensor histidine kinase and response regulator CckA [Blastocatellia bacterium]|jgi:PAS domain S-box-containing protein|nr:two-component system, cell cycle sensor histidine kinase and response regulator CckA [Blastocatellia bacterium]